jgi:hypothetical protein
VEGRLPRIASSRLSRSWRKEEESGPAEGRLALDEASVGLERGRDGGLDDDSCRVDRWLVLSDHIETDKLFILFQLTPNMLFARSISPREAPLS